MTQFFQAFVIEDETRLTTCVGMFEQAPHEWTALLDWCRFHGLDPERMPAGQVIERDVAGRRIVYDEYVLTRDQVQAAFRAGDPEPLRRHRVVEQGEAPPLPFPDVILRHLEPMETR